MNLVSWTTVSFLTAFVFHNFNLLDSLDQKVGNQNFVLTVIELITTKSKASHASYTFTKQGA
jgi:putative exporter of polyketide antibiotics